MLQKRILPQKKKDRLMITSHHVLNAYANVSVYSYVMRLCEHDVRRILCEGLYVFVIMLCYAYIKVCTLFFNVRTVVTNHQHFIIY